MNNEPMGNIVSVKVAGTVAEFCAAVAVVANSPTPEDILANKHQFVEKYLAMAMSSPSAMNFLGSPESTTYKQMATYIRAVCEHSLSVLEEVK